VLFATAVERHTGWRLRRGGEKRLAGKVQGQV
jgi:hypothetical protein